MSSREFALLLVRR